MNSIRGASVARNAPAASVPAVAVQGIRPGDLIQTGTRTRRVEAVIRNVIHCTDGTTITRVGS